MKKLKAARVPIRIVVRGQGTDDARREVAVRCAVEAGFSSVAFEQFAPFEGKPMVSVYLSGVKRGAKPTVLGPLDL